MKFQYMISAPIIHINPNYDFTPNFIPHLIKYFFGTLTTHHESFGCSGEEKRVHAARGAAHLLREDAQLGQQHARVHGVKSGKGFPKHTSSLQRIFNFLLFLLTLD